MEIFKKSSDIPITFDEQTTKSILLDLGSKHFELFIKNTSDPSMVDVEADDYISYVFETEPEQYLEDYPDLYFLISEVDQDTFNEGFMDAFYSYFTLKDMEPDDEDLDDIQENYMSIRSYKDMEPDDEDLGDIQEDYMSIRSYKDMEDYWNRNYFVTGKTYVRDYKNTYTSVPTKAFGKFDKKEDSDLRIVFNKELSEEFDYVFRAANGKEIMFFGELSTEDGLTYNVDSMNFPPQNNYGAYVDTVDGKYELWMFEQVKKGKKFPLHVHTHPDFSAYSSGVDEKQFKGYIEDNEGNPFVVQLIVSNPRKGRYFIRWFDLENKTWETPKVEFTYEDINIEDKYPGIFNFSNKKSNYNNLDYVLKKHGNETNVEKSNNKVTDTVDDTTEEIGFGLGGFVNHYDSVGSKTSTNPKKRKIKRKKNRRK